MKTQESPIVYDTFSHLKQHNVLFYWKTKISLRVVVVVGVSIHWQPIIHLSGSVPYTGLDCINYRSNNPFLFKGYIT